MFAIARFSTSSIAPWSERELAVGVERAVELLSARPGYLGAHFGKATDPSFDRSSSGQSERTPISPESIYALITHWENVGSYRRALSGFDIKMEVVPLLSRAIDEPGGFQEIESDHASEVLDSSLSD